jgi:hypothetical protein
MMCKRRVFQYDHPAKNIESEKLTTRFEKEILNISNIHS